MPRNNPEALDGAALFDGPPAAGPDSAAKPERVRHEAFGLFFISEERAAAYAAQRASQAPLSLDETLALIFARQEEAAQ
jgi:hypothetical protein